MSLLERGDNAYLLLAEDAELQKVIDNLSIFINCILFKEDIIQ